MYVIEARSGVYWNADALDARGFTAEIDRDAFAKAIKFTDKVSADVVIFHLLDERIRPLVRATEHQYADD